MGRTMSKEEMKELDALRLKIESWLERTNENNLQRQKLKREKKRLLNKLDALERRYLGEK